MEKCPHRWGRAPRVSGEAGQRANSNFYYVLIYKSPLIESRSPNSSCVRNRLVVAISLVWNSIIQIAMCLRARRGRGDLTPAVRKAG